MEASKRKPKTIAALVLVLVSSALGLYSVWGVIFIAWVVASGQNGTTHLVEEIHRADNPLLFWLIAAMWGLFGLSMIAYDVAYFAGYDVSALG